MGKAKLIVALDVDTAKKAEKFVRLLYPEVRIFKVGSQLFTAAGPKIVTDIRKKGAEVFLDLKFHDIPNTVGRAAAAAARLGVFMMTMHSQGGREMLEAGRQAVAKAAREAGRKRPLIVAVTVLTSQEAADVGAQVLELARVAQSGRADGVVASAKECASLKRFFGEKFLVVTPGIRPAAGERGDQKRVATAREAVAAGSDFLVVGRPILEAKDPVLVARQILKEMRTSHDGRAKKPY